MSWTVGFTSKADKQAGKLPRKERDLLALLVREMQLSGPVRSNWKNYSKLGKDTHHCHLSYRWVACWRVENNEMKVIEVYYVGSRENAPY